MATLANGYMTLVKLKEIVATLEEKQKENEKVKGLYFTIGIYDEPNKYNQNVSLFVQTKEMKDEGIEKYFFGNGKVVWTDGKVTVMEKDSNYTRVTPTSDELETENRLDKPPF